MPLSEHEERILAEIERNLKAEDPQFVQRTKRAVGGVSPARRLRWSLVGFVVGLICLLGLTFNILFGFLGFALMLTSVMVGVEALRSAEGAGGDLMARLRDLAGGSGGSGGSGESE